MNEETITLTLGNEEVALLLHIMRAKTLPGLGEDPLGGIDEQQAAAALVSAERSLRARGVITVNEAAKRVEISAIALALVGTCLKSQRSFLATTVSPDGTNHVCYYHVTDRLTVEHSFPEVGLQQFTGAAEAREMLARVSGHLRLDGQMAATGGGGKVTQAAFDQAKGLAQQGNTGDALKTLEDGGLSPQAAGELVKTLEDPVRSGSFLRVDYTQPGDRAGKINARGFACLEGKNGLWLLLPDENDKNPLVAIEPQSANDVESRIEALLE
jgi:hypothetical protein